MAINDGSTNAPAGSAQHPNLLSGEAVRPAWFVAGVDYAVGIPSGTILKDPSTISTPGVSVDTRTHVITVTGNNVTLDGYDFSLNGGWQVQSRAANTTIIDSKFVIGANNLTPIFGPGSGTNITVRYCEIDGGAKDVQYGGIITQWGAGLTVEYSWVKNAGADMFQTQGGGAVTLRYNLLEGAGQALQGHADYLQSANGPFVDTILFNTLYQSAGSSQGIMLEPDNPPQPAGVITSGEYGYNTFVALPVSTMDGTSLNFMLGITVADIVNTVTVHDNYFDARGAYGFTAGGARGGPNDSSAKTIFVNNVNMVTGTNSSDSTSTPQPPVDTAPPAQPVVSSFSPDTAPTRDGHTTATVLSLTGTGEANSTIQAFDGTKFLGTALVNASGLWSFTTGSLATGIHNFTATDTDAAGNTSVASTALAVTVDSGGTNAPTNLVVNGGFETGNFIGWKIGPYQPEQTIISDNEHSGQFAAALGPAGGVGSLSQDLVTTPGQHYTLDFWLANMSTATDNFTVKWDGTTVMGLVNQPAQGYTEYEFDVVATNSTTHLEFTYRQDPTQWRLDDISVKPNDISVTPGAPTSVAVIGTTGNDTLTNPAGTKSNTLTGNGGDDKFVFSGAHFGEAIITDFDAVGRRHDVIQFDKAVFANFTAVQSQAAQVGSDVVITVDAANSLKLTGVSLGYLSSADFLFV